MIATHQPPETSMEDSIDIAPERKHLNVAPGYVPAWGPFEGLRELAQNWLDEADVSGTAGEVTLDDEILRLSNPGSTLPRSALLFGGGDKANTKALRGQFGEGLKLGILALVRAGFSVAIEAGGERWTFVIDGGEFVCDIAPSEAAGVVVEVSGQGLLHGWPADIGTAWNDARQAFRCFADLGHVAETERGTILLEEQYQGLVMVKGIAVCREEDLKYGFDFKHVAVDRDRKLARSFDIDWEAARIVQAATEAGQVRAHELLAMMAEDCRESQYVGRLSPLSKDRATEVAAAFRLAHGADAIAVVNSAQADRAAQLGRRGIVQPEPLVDLLAPVIGGLGSIEAEARLSINAHIADADLTDTERAVVEWARGEVGAVASWSAPPVAVVEFFDPANVSQLVDHRACIARRILGDRLDTLSALVRVQACHEAGDKGDRFAALGKLWTGIARRWQGGTATSDDVAF